MKGELLSIETTQKLAALEKAKEYMKNYIEVEDSPFTEPVRIEFKEVLKILGDDTNE